MTRSRTEHVQSVPGTDLIVLGRAAAEEAVKARYGELAPWKDTDDLERRQNSSFYLNGWKAADGVALNPALQTDYQTPKQIEDVERRERASEEAILKRAQVFLSARKQAEEYLQRKSEAAAAAAAAISAAKARFDAMMRTEEIEWQASLQRRAVEAARQARLRSIIVRAYVLALVGVLAFGLIYVYAVRH